MDKTTRSELPIIDKNSVGKKKLGNNSSLKKTKKKELTEEEKLKKKYNEDQYKKLENYIEESGLPLAFNIIFAELISKQIMPENFFTYTSMRLIQIGKEIEGLKTKDSIYVDADTVQKTDTEVKTTENQNSEKVQDDVFLTQPENKNKV